ncbi:diguanylate cyclase (GGDEF) domain-containing protein [Hoeflea sp. IMCC20628]|uniref:GGDEF domain-containing protein n=1 Tax=Hoeflea sp. IMCC20628 TaxID=1620421 RepID=UPI00063AFDCB|nr:GGDEF domain-containing protein [Hoeflea sp. IMCC20628]AKH99596.1 diguanylate cyclase (GGDEF) domain-containing protein [Hoeflea sp. IMCC20628]
MVVVVKNWIVRQFTLDEFESPRHVWRHAISMGLKITVCVYSFNVAVHFLFNWFGLLPYTLSAGLIAASVLTPLLTFPVSTVGYAVLGFAFYDLGKSRAELKHLSRTDPLTGLMNRRAILDSFDQCDREKAMLVLDIDHFKSVNDTYGHLVGDEVISEVAALLRAVFDDRCICARIGGEEFAVTSCAIPFAEFAALGEAARTRIALMRTEAEGGAFSITVSGGIARALPDQKFGETFSRADKALYAAKSGGRDRIVLSYEAGQEDQHRQNANAA